MANPESNSPIGYEWLRHRFRFRHNHHCSSKISSRRKSEIDQHGNAIEYYLPSYWPGDEILDHIEFALAYEGLNLGILTVIFNKMDSQDISAHIAKTPNGKFSRQIGFLYEFLLGNELPEKPVTGGNYVDIANPELYVLPKGIKDQRWRINNNLPGPKEFCPLVRKSEQIIDCLNTDFSKLVEDTFEQIPEDLLIRAINYFYFKETKSSNEIEREVPNEDSKHRFIALLKTAGSMPIEDRLTEQELVKCQNSVAANKYQAFRTQQNYVGEMDYTDETIVHLVSMPPQYIHQTINGMMQFAQMTTDMHPLIRAACISFGFVFIHPFEDGNGRLHRFLINDVLANDGVIKAGLVLPISVVMQKTMHEYDKSLESFSKPLLRGAEFTLDNKGAMTVKNGHDILNYYQYPDMTAQAEYVSETVKETITNEMVKEFAIIEAFDRFKADLKEIIELPTMEREKLAAYIFQNQSISSAKRRQFPAMTDQQVLDIDLAFKEAFKEIYPKRKALVTGKM